MLPPHVQALASRLTEALLARDTRRSGDEIAFRCVADTHEDRQASASWNVVKAAWICHACGARGNARELAGLLGLDTASPVVARRPRRAATPPSRPAPGFTPAQASELWSQCHSNTGDDRAAMAWLDKRGLHPAVENGTIRIVPTDRSLPGRIHWWHEHGYAIAAPLYDLDGTLVGVQARSIKLDADPKVRVPKGCPMSRMVFASADGLLVLRGESVPGPVVLAEGLTDTAALSFTSSMPVIGCPGTSAARHAIGPWASGRTILVGLDRDQAGDDVVDAVSSAASDHGVRRLARVRWPNHVGDACDVLDQRGPEGLSAFLRRLQWEWADD